MANKLISRMFRPATEEEDLVIDTQSMNAPQDVLLSKINRDPGKFLFRQRIVESQVSDLRKILHDGLELKPVDLFQVEGLLWLVHGHHRDRAHQDEGRASIKAVIHQGTMMDALEFAWRANGEHGEKLSDEDNLLKVASILKHKPTTSDTEIAKIISKSVSFVGDARKQLESNGATQKPVDADGNEIRMATRKGKDGKVTTYQIKVGGIGAKSKPAPINAATPSTNGYHATGDGKITKTIRLTVKEWDDLRGLLAGSEIGRVVLGQIGE